MTSGMAASYVPASLIEVDGARFGEDAKIEEIHFVALAIENIRGKSPGSVWFRLQFVCHRATKWSFLCLIHRNSFVAS
jgi:hypothetical protein